MSGEVMMEADYTPFGEEIDIQALSNPDWQRDDIDHFTGHDPIDGFGLINMQARLYDPVTGRFLSPDTIVPHPDNILSYNRYVYVHNNPVNYIDPDGHDPFSIALIVIGSALLTTSYTTDDAATAQITGALGTIALSAGFAVANGFTLKAGFTSLKSAAFAGAETGFTQSFISSGGDLGAAAEGAVIGGATAGITFGLAHGAEGGASIFKGLGKIGNFVALSASHVVVQGVSSELSGGQFRDGAIGAVFAKIGGQAAGASSFNVTGQAAIVAGFAYLGAKALGSDDDDAVMQAVGAAVKVFLYNELGKGEKESGGQKNNQELANDAREEIARIANNTEDFISEMQDIGYRPLTKNLKNVLLITHISDQLQRIAFGNLNPSGLPIHVPHPIARPIGFWDSIFSIFNLFTSKGHYGFAYACGSDICDVEAYEKVGN